MDFFRELADNKIFMTAAAGWLVAQVLKTLMHLILVREFKAERLVGSGGMPSSHSSTDAMGVRRETGIQAKLLNDILRTFEDMGRSEISAHDKLKEFVGHTPFQVLIGAILGVFIAFLAYQVY